MTRRPKTLRTPGAADAGRVASATTWPALEPVADRYAVALTPALAALIDPTDPTDPIARQFVPSLAELDARPRSGPTRSATRPTAPCPGSCIATRTACCSSCCMSARSIAASASAASVVGPGAGAVLSPETVTEARSLYRGAPGDLGGDPDRRRPADAVAAPARGRHAPARRDRPRQDRAPAHPRAGRRPRRASRPSWSRRCAARARPPMWRCTPITRANSARGAGRLRAPGRRRARRC